MLNFVAASTDVHHVSYCAQQWDCIMYVCIFTVRQNGWKGQKTAWSISDGRKTLKSIKSPNFKIFEGMKHEKGSIIPNFGDPS